MIAPALQPKIVIPVDVWVDGIEQMSGNFTHGGFITRRELGNPKPVLVIDADHLAHQREWSMATFGPGLIEADPTDLAEWVDVIILAFDGAWRAGWEPAEILAAIKAKQARNEARTWPDWRSMSADHAIEHDRTVSGAS